jgi:hypothetical protein
MENKPQLDPTCLLIPVEQLKPHPSAERMPMDDDDHAGLEESIKESGIHTPLQVIPWKKNLNMYLIINGCNRFKLGVAAGLSHFSCKVLAPKTQEEEDQIVFDCLTGRQNNSSLRVLVWLEMHKTEVLEANRLEEIRKRPAHLGGDVSRETSPPEEYSEWTSKAIAEKLRVCRQDVISGIQLLKAIEAGKMEPTRYAQIKHPNIDPEKQRECVLAFRKQVLSGHGSLRRVNSAIQGALFTKGQGKSPPDHKRLISVACTSLMNAFAKWDEIEWGEDPVYDRHATEQYAKEKITALFTNLPEFIRPILHNCIVKEWKPEQVERLHKVMHTVLKNAEQEKKS